MCFGFGVMQRRMQKLKSGVFSITLKLYPGSYEVGCWHLDYFSMFMSDPLVSFPIILQIKFIVDGQWKVDPLRPIVYNNGFQNNLFTVN